MHTFFKNRYILLFWSVLLFLLIPPFFPADYFKSIIITILLSIMVFQGASLMFDSEKKTKYGIGIGLFIIAIAWIAHFFEITDNDMMFTNILLLLYFVYILFLLIRHMIKSKRVDLNMIMMAITIYLLIAVAGGFLFAFLNEVYDNAYNISADTSFALIDFIYYSFVTLTTLGYGDVLPMREETRSLAALLATGGQFYIAVVLAFMVSKYTGKQE